MFLIIFVINIKDMKEFFASRLTQGNELFPTRIRISEQGVSIREPGFFSGRERTISFRHVASVQIDCPFIGYSTILRTQELRTLEARELSIYPKDVS